MKKLSILVLVIVSSVNSTHAAPIGPENFGPNAKIEDFEGLANIVFTETILSSSNPHYIVTNNYLFNGDLSLTEPDPNPPTPGETIGVVLIGDFSQGTNAWGWGQRVMESADDVYSGSAYLGCTTGTPLGEPETTIFTFNFPVMRVGAWFDAYTDELFTLSVLNYGGLEIESVSTTLNGWAFLGIQSETPIWSVSFTGYSPVVDNLAYEIPEPTTLLLLGLGALMARRKR